jgi:diguanylate cyclase (GGDEF)-like protein
MSIPPSPASDGANMIRDPLTGAYSRALLQERYQEEIERARRYGMHCSLCVFDLDYFKSVNDAYGHARGDAVLRELVQHIGTMLRSSDLLFRYGGDEFILLCPNTAKNDAALLAQRILDYIQATPFAGEPPLSVSLSIGVASFPEDAQTSEALFEAADRRNYLAKRQGRAQVVASDSRPRSAVPQLHMSRLIERDEALDQAHHFLEQVPAARSGVLSVVGPGGSGRTRFLAKVAEAARLRGAMVVALSGSAAARLRPYGALLDADCLHDLRLPINANTIKDALHRLIGDHAGIVFTVDNVADLDRATVAVLRQMLAGVDDRYVAVAYAIDLDTTRRRFHLHAPLRDVVELRPLSQHGLRVWIRSLLQWEPPADFLAWLHSETAGLPQACYTGLTYLLEQGILEQTQEHMWQMSRDYSTIALSERLGVRVKVPTHNLPATLTTFVGRERELEQLTTLLDTNRLITLFGPGGVGKTRLALQAAIEVLEEFPDGVFWFPLATIDTPEAMLQAIATAFGFKEAGNQSLSQSLALYLRDKRRLLVLDNFEQITAAAPLVTELLGAAPQLKIIVTSRTVLRVYGEHVFHVPPLALPQLSSVKGSLPPTGDLLHYPAIALFMARTHAIQPDFSLTTDNARAVIELCQRLDGLPLAIELAAARSDLLTPEEMLRQITSRLSLLTDGPRDLPARQQTLRNAIGWSYELLSAAEQQLFAQLAVFVGSFTVEAAQAVCSLTPDDAAARELTSLIDKSLLRVEQSVEGELRFIMLETIREFALEQLAIRADGDAIRTRHASFYMTRAELAEPHLMGAEQQQWLNWLEADHYNLQAAMRWAIEQKLTTVSLRLSAAIWRFWAMHSHAGEGRKWLQAALSEARDNADLQHLRAKALLGLGTLAWLQSDYQEALPTLTASVLALRGVNDPIALATALNNLGLVCREQGDYDEAQRYFAESLTIRQSIGDRRGMAFTLGNLGRVAFYQMQIAEAAAYTEESLQIFRELNDEWGLATSLFDLAEVLLYRGDYAQAAQLVEEQLQLSRSLGDKSLLGFALCSLGELAYYQEQWMEAHRWLVEALVLQHEIGDKEGGVATIERLAELSVSQDQVVHATRLWTAAQSQRLAIGAPLPLVYQARHTTMMAMLQDRLDAEVFQQARLDGQAMTWNQMVAEALDYLKITT